MSNGGSSRVLIPNNIRKMIHDIKEIASNHNDDDIHAMLKECNMDPNETAQRLLYLDTFQEVKKKRVIRKVNVNSCLSEESRWRTGTQGRGFMAGRGHYSSSHNYHGAGGGRNVIAPKENGVNNSMERGFNPFPTVQEKTEKNVNSRVPISSNISVNGAASITNGSSGYEHAPKTSADPVVAPPLYSPNPSIRASKDEASSHKNASKSGATFPAVIGSIATCTITDSIHTTSGDVSDAMLKESPNVGKNLLLEHSQPSQLIGLSQVVASEDATLAVDGGGSEPLSEQKVSVLQNAIPNLDTKLEKLNISSFPVVIFPSHLQVPEDIKNGLTFGSLDFEQSVNLGNVPDDSDGSLPAPELLLEADKTDKETSWRCNINICSSSQEEDYLDNPHSLPHVPAASKEHLEEDCVSAVAAPTYDRSKQDSMSCQGGPQYPIVHIGPNYGFPFIHPMLGSQLVQCEGAGPQSENSTVSSPSAKTTQSASQPADVGQSCIAASSPPPFPVFRQPYSPYYYPFAPYFPSFYPFAPNGQQLIGPSGLPSQTSTGNIFLSPAAAAAVPGTKFSVPQGKSGINAGYLPRFGVPCGYNSYSPSPTVTCGNSSSNEEIAASGLMENSVYSIGKQGEGAPPRLWLPAPGRDILHANSSFYNHLPQGQQQQQLVAFSPPPPPGIYHPSKTTVSPTSTAHPCL